MDKKIKEVFSKNKNKFYVGLITVVIVLQILGFPTIGSRKDTISKISEAQRASYFQFRDYKETWKREIWRFPNLSEFLYKASINVEDNSGLTEAIYHFTVGEIKYDENSNRTTFIKHAEAEKNLYSSNK